MTASPVADLGIHKGGSQGWARLRAGEFLQTTPTFSLKHAHLRNWTIPQVYSQIFVRRLFEWHAVRISIIGKTAIMVDTWTLVQFTNNN